MSQDIKLDYNTSYKKSALRFKTNEYLLLGGGPTNVSDRVLKALSQQCLVPYGVDMFQMMDEVKPMLQYVFQTKNRLTVAAQTSGNGGNETIIVNLLDPGDKIVIAIGGFWGELVFDMAQRHDLDILSLRKPPGEIYSLEELEGAVSKHKADLLFVTHGESTGGILQQLEHVGPMCHKYDCLLAVDAVVSIAVDPLFVDRWELDAVSAGSQKAIGAPAGFCMLTFSERAEQRMRAKKTRSPYYLDVNLLGSYWNCFGGQRRYIYTLSSNMLAAVREALAQICEEGLAEMWKRHQKNSRLFWKKLEEIGYECFVQNAENRFHGVTCVKVPNGIDEFKLLEFFKKKYAIDITPGHGPSGGKAMRVGLMGQNSTPEVVDYLIQAFKDGLQHFRKQS